jgi:hypothetical protein
MNSAAWRESKSSRCGSEARFSNEELVLTGQDIKCFVLLTMKMCRDMGFGGMQRLELEIASTIFGWRDFDDALFQDFSLAWSKLFWFHHFLLFLITFCFRISGWPYCFSRR